MTRFTLGLRTLRSFPNIMFGVSILVGISLATALVIIVGTGDPLTQAVSRRLEPPSGDYLLGTDAFGRDVLTRAAHGGLVSLSVAVAAVCLGGAVGGGIGLISGVAPRSADRTLVAVMSVLQSLPSLLLALLVSTVLGGGKSSIILSIAIANIALFARLVRGETLRLRTQLYVEAARSVGASSARIVFAHLVPNMWAVLLVALTLRLSSAILLEATLSYLGLGINPPEPTWGNMIYEGQRYLDSALWLSLAPGTAITCTVLGVNLLGDGLRDLIDPRIRRSLTS